MKLIKYTCAGCYDYKKEEYFTFYLHQHNDWDDPPFCPNCMSDKDTANEGEVDAEEL
jgi:hypothetical protein